VSAEGGHDEGLLSHVLTGQILKTPLAGLAPQRLRALATMLGCRKLSVRSRLLNIHI
jgi:hypothetical protein